ncbi:SDR family NAD(P)-dependent oxidoreductase [Nocardioidaceae bacterium]|nr:SDR family NAD(P)-dependent oxidoreductase [Nocardioidaceae bacterium]
MSSSTPGVVVVTGASGGIGAAICRRFAREGWTVVGTSRDAASAPAPEGVAMRDLDVADAASVRSFVHEVLGAHGRVDVLVNNAGIGAVGAAEDTEVEILERVLQVNLTGVARLTRALLPGMRDRGTGRVVNVSSAVGLVPAPYMAAYAASKHALEGWSVSVDHETREHGVRVLLVEPGYTDTGFDDAVLRPAEATGAYDRRVEALEAFLTRALRSGDSPEVVAAVVWKAATGAVWTVRFPAGRLAHVAAAAHRLAPRPVFDAALRRAIGLPFRPR